MSVYNIDRINRLYEYPSSSLNYTVLMCWNYKNKQINGTNNINLFAFLMQ